MKSYQIISLLLLYSNLSIAENICRKENPQWYTCAQNQECIITHDACGYPLEASNKKSLAMVEKCNRTIGTSMSCPAWDEKSNEKREAICESMICIAKKTTANHADVFTRSITPIDKSNCFDQHGNEILKNHCVCYHQKGPCGNNPASASTCSQLVCEQWTCHDDGDCAQISAKCKDHYCKRT